MLLAFTTLPQILAADTVIARIVPPVATWFEQVIIVADGLLALATFALLVFAIWAALKMRRALENAKQSLDEVRTDIRELISTANRIGDDLTGVTQSVRSSVESVSDTVTYTNERAHHAVSRLADRVDAFNDALELVQEDTQEVVVTALAALRGIRAGLSAVRKPARKKRKRREIEEEDEDVIELDVDEYGTEVKDDDERDAPARPRLRRRARGRA